MIRFNRKPIGSLPVDAATLVLSSPANQRTLSSDLYGTFVALSVPKVLSLARHTLKKARAPRGIRGAVSERGGRGATLYEHQAQKLTGFWNMSF